ncbi:alginate lyase [candidate division KSB1 bacterium]|nr:alginate lyase [candidate division KSB1 bacterium]
MRDFQYPLAIFIFLSSLLLACQSHNPHSSIWQEVADHDRDRILEQAKQALSAPIVTVTDSVCQRSEGGTHDFYSEGDYWWPDPEHLDGPYIRRDGLTNPDNFTAHRRAMRQMSIHVAALAAAFEITGESKYASRAIDHLDAWFINPKTRMNPHMKFAQAIKGRVPGRGVGLIDGIHLVEPAQCVSLLEASGQLTSQQVQAIKVWFVQFLDFMTQHEYGIDERERKNNHGSCWVMQAAQFASLVGDTTLMNYCRHRYKTVLLPNQMATDGSFPMELERTKPYGYSLFNIDAMTMVVHILSDDQHDLWSFTLDEGQGIAKGIEFIYPYIRDKQSWPYEPDVMYWDEWPLRHPSLLFAGIHLNKPEYIELWKTLPADPKTEEGWRNFPIRQPVLWIE